MDRTLQPWLRRFRYAVALGVTLAGLLVAVAAGSVPSLYPAGTVRVNLPPSAGLVLATMGLSLAAAGPLAAALALPALGLGALFAGLHLGALAGALDLSQGVAPVPSPTVTASLLGAGAFLLLRVARRPRLAWLGQICALLTILNDMRGLLGLLMLPGGPLQLPEISGQVEVGSVANILLALGALASRPEAGFMPLVSSPRPAGRLLRRLVVVGVAMPLLVALLTSAAWRAGIFGASVGAALLILSNLLLLYHLASTYASADCARQAAEERLALANAELERRVAERTAALEEREAQLRAIGDNLPGAMIYSFVREPEGAPRFVYLSAGVQTLAGLSVEAALADPALLYSQIEPAQLARFLEAEQAARAALAPLDAEVCKRTPGGRRWSRIRSRPRRLGDGQVVWDGIEVDITAQKEAEALIERDRRYQAALFACSHALATAQADGGRQRALEAALRALLQGAGASRAFLMQNVADPARGSAAVLRAEVCAPGVASGAPQMADRLLPWDGFGAEALARLRAGRPIIASTGADSALVPMAGALRELFGVTSVALLPLQVGDSWWGAVGLHACDAPREWDGQEVLLLSTAAEQIGAALQRWADEDELRGRERLLATLFDLLPAGVALVDAGLRPLRVNRAMAAIAGEELDPIIAGACGGLRYIYPDGAPVPSAALPSARAVAGEVVRDLEVGVARPGGDLRWLSISAAPLPVEGLAAALVAVDITERRRIEDERLAFERRLLEAQRLESLGVLAGGVAHDFNNILTAILGHAELARLDLPAGSETAVSLDAITLGARRAADLTAQMLAYAGRGRFVIEPVQLNQVAEELRELTRATLPRGLSVRYTLADGLPSILADPTQVRQVLLNLLTNAAEATGAGGAISVVTGAARLAAADLQGAAFSAARPGPCCYFQVADSGPGMDAETLARIFEPFFSTKFTGRGLGLAAVQGIMRAHSGALFVRSAPGAGATFCACFPVATADTR
jgi:signal transduction histidine kinase